MKYETQHVSILYNTIYDSYILILRIPENNVDSLRGVFSDGAHEIKQIRFDGIPHHVSIDQISPYIGDTLSQCTSSVDKDRELRGNTNELVSQLKFWEYLISPSPCGTTSY